MSYFLFEASITYDDALAALLSMWAEICFMVFFLVGFAILRSMASSKKNAKLPKNRHANEFACQARKTLEVEIAGSRPEKVAPEKVLSNWRMARDQGASSSETLKVVVQAFLKVQPASLMTEIMEHLETHRELCTSKTIAAILDIVARAGRMSVMEELFETVQQRLGFVPSYHIYEVLLSGYAASGLEAKVHETLSKMRPRFQLSVRSHSLIIKGYLKNGMVQAALQQMHAMQKQGLFVPSCAITQLCRVACEISSRERLLDAVQDWLPLTSDALSILLGDCQKRDDLQMAFRVEKLAHCSKLSFPANAYESFLKLCVVHAHLYALQLFEELQSSGARITEGFCVALILRCAASKFVRFAEVVMCFLRSREGTTLAAYSALMKVYAQSGMYGNACDLYAQIRDEGLEPDAVMYGCLIKFSVECGRTELSQELFNRSPALDIQKYVSLIRAAGLDKDVNRAFALLEKLKSTGVSVDMATCNCVLDVCVSAGDMKRAGEVLRDMKSLGELDIIAYNTFLKGYCNSGDIQSAKGLLQEMEAAGVAPNDVSYNCLINAAVSSGNFTEAWFTIERMQACGFPVDNYTVSILMKALKRSKNARDHVAKALELLDRSGLDVFADDILLNAVLETCIRHRELQRLESIVSIFSQSNHRPSVQTYAALIKAHGTLKQIEKCHHLWYDMTEQRAMMPTDIVLGCMLDALVCNDSIDDAMTLFNTWKERVPPNTVMYSTIIKGLANTRQSSRAMDLFREMKEMQVHMDTVVYNVLIDSQARTGAMNEVSELQQNMEAMGCKPDAVTHSIIVKGYSVQGNLDKALEVLHSMQRDKMAFDCGIYNVILDNCIRHNRLDLADFVVADMEQNLIRPSNLTLSTLVKICDRRRQLGKAFEIVQEFSHKHGLQPNAQVKTCLMRACLNNNNVNMAYEVLRVIKSSGDCVDAKSYGALIQGNIRLGHLQEAVRLVEDAYGIGQRRGLPPTQTLEAEPLEHLMRALAQKGHTESLGLPLLEQLRAANVPLSSRLFSFAKAANALCK